MNNLQINGLKLNNCNCGGKPCLRYIQPMTIVYCTECGDGVGVSDLREYADSMPGAIEGWNRKNTGRETT